MFSGPGIEWLSALDPTTRRADATERTPAGAGVADASICTRLPDLPTGCILAASLIL